MATTKQRRTETNCIRQQISKRRREKIALLAVDWGLERFRFHLYGKQIHFFSDHQALEPLLKKNKINKQYSARLTRWLHRLNHFDMTLKNTAGKETKFTDFISCNPTENAEPEANYEEVFVINAIAQLATVYGRIGRIFNQSENSNTTKTDSMHDTRKWTGTRGCKTNNGHSNSTLTAYQTNIDKSKRTAYSAQKTMADNNNNRQNPDKFNRDNQLKYHWGADDEIMKIINRRDISPETKELAERRIELTKPGHMGYQWHKKLDREILLPRRPNDSDRKEIKRIDIRLRRKEECCDTHLGDGYFNDFGDEIPTTTGPYTETNPDRISIQKVIHDTESTVSSTPKKPTTTQEPGTYPAIPVQEYRDGPIEEIAVR